MMSTHGRFAAARRRLDLHKTMCIAVYCNDSYKRNFTWQMKSHRYNKSVDFAVKFSMKLAVHACAA